MRSGTKKNILVFIVTSFLLLVLLYCFQFNNSLTTEDAVYADKIIKENGIDTNGIHESFESELAFISAVQNAVVKLSKVGEGIPQCHERNVKDLYISRMGLCYDNSHVIEKILTLYGFETRHVCMYLYKHWYEYFIVFFKLNSYSHAVSEVKTSKGWMFLDSLSSFKGLINNLQPVTLYKVRTLIYSKNVPTEILSSHNYSSKFIFLYGVYSRNGKLYAPYNWVPDYQFNEVRYNFCF